MLHKFFSIYFWVTLFAVTLAAGLVWMDHFRAYEGEINVVVIEKTGAMNVAETLADLSRNLSFYDAVLAQNDALTDPFYGWSPDERKAGWQDIATFSNHSGSGVIEIHVIAEDQETTRLLTRAATETLFDVASRYFDVKNQIDVRIVDGPILHPMIRSIPTFLVVSVATGFGVTIVFFLLLVLLEHIFATKQKAQSGYAPDAYQHVSAETFRPTLPTAFWANEEPYDKSEEGRVVTHKDVENDLAPREMVTPSVKAAAPSNLPILEDEELTPLQGAMARLVKEDIDTATALHAVEPEPKEPISSEPLTQEPSAEEYKRRLNALLSGKM